MQIAELEPSLVFRYFEEISNIPHGSGNTAALAAYCMEFAKKRNIDAYQDAYGNVMLFQKGTSGYELSEPVILQGHLDMVCEKAPGCLRDMDREGVSLVTDGEYVWADGTSLGGDDGIAVAYILALLDSKGLPHPPIEALLTSDEEIGLRGAGALDASRLTGRRLINLDSEEEGMLIAGCAGGVRIQSKLPLTRIKAGAADMCAQRLCIGGLLGGHSGIDIDKCRKNAVKVLAELLYELNRQLDVRIADISSGGRLNVIPSAAEAVICVPKNQAEKLRGLVGDFDLRLKKACEAVEPNAFAAVEPTELPESFADQQSAERILFMLLQMPDGVCAMSPNIPGLVQTSLNAGSTVMGEMHLEIGFMVRSNTALGTQTVLNRLESLVMHLDGEMQLSDEYPAWEYRRNSPLREVMTRIYSEMYGKEPVVCTIHAGLECGILLEKLGEADMVSLGPDMGNVHTPSERICVASVERCWRYLLHVLEALK